ncbi:MAG: hypothetical protein HY815_18255 [Candidatus Riflebacteria bacterium]|nr:hypothetical protein [Candidatus Riflebacteria bacterium]
MHVAGQPVQIPIIHRNVTRVHFAACPIDLDRFIQENLEKVKLDRMDDVGNAFGALYNPGNALLSRQTQGRPMHEAYRGPVVAEWDAAVIDDGSFRTTRSTIASPLSQRGCYLIVASVPGQGEDSRNLLLLQDTAVVVKKLEEKELFWVVNAGDGAPIAGAELTHLVITSRWERRGHEPGERQHWAVETAVGKTDKEGVSLFRVPGKARPSYPHVITVARTPSGGMAFHGVTHWSHIRGGSVLLSGRRGAVFTDRPVYRPDQSVRFKLWVRDLRDGVYQSAAQGATVTVDVRDPRGGQVASRSLALDAHGGASDAFRLAKGCPLGMYRIDVRGVKLAGARFRVEEYKKPEFEVTVETRTDLARPGDRVEGMVRARYAFGAPVTQGRVTYRIFRQEYSHRHAAPGSWDWLYGPGYGRSHHAYDWFPWWRLWGPRPCSWSPWWGPAPAPERELVTEGTGDLGAGGELPFTVDTTRARQDHPDQDHLYTVEAQVVDRSRRTIEGSGQVKVTRQEFAVFVEADRGHYRPGQQVSLKIKAVTANDTPVAVPGKVTVTQVVYGGAGNADVTERPDRTFDLATDARGDLSLDLKLERSGHFKVAFETADSQKRPVIGATTVWVCGDDFEGAIHRFKALQILADQRTYRPGDVARLMISSDLRGATVLLSTRPDRWFVTSYRVVPLPDKSTIVELPIEKGDEPNVFVEATAVVGGQVHQDVLEVLVPPENGVMDLAVKPDKPRYRPGEKATVRLKATTPQGKPVKTQIALAAFDRSVLLIQPELAPDLRAHFWGEKRTHSIISSSTLSTRFDGTGPLRDPGRLSTGSPPQDRDGSWGRRGLVHWGSGDDETAGPPASFESSGGATEGKKDVRLTRRKLEPADPRPSGYSAWAGEGRGRPEPGEAPLVAAHFRSEFEDTAHWAPDLVTDDNGEATTTFSFPENLTTWRLRALAMAQDTRVGDGAGQAVTTKRFVARLQSPRFFVERDRVTLSVNLHNYLAADKKARVTLTVPAALMQIAARPTREVVVKAGGEARVDWDVSVKADGLATIEVEALTDEESDAVRMTFPVLIHGLEKTVSRTGLIRSTGPADDQDGLVGSAGTQPGGVEARRAGAVQHPAAREGRPGEPDRLVRGAAGSALVLVEQRHRIPRLDPQGDRGQGPQGRQGPVAGEVALEQPSPRDLLAFHQRHGALCIGADRVHASRRRGRAGLHAEGAVRRQAGEGGQGRPDPAPLAGQPAHAVRRAAGAGSARPAVRAAGEGGPLRLELPHDLHEGGGNLAGGARGQGRPDLLPPGSSRPDRDDPGIAAGRGA